MKGDRSLQAVLLSSGIWRFRWGIVTIVVFLTLLYVITVEDELIKGQGCRKNAAFVEQNFESLEQSDSRLVEYVRTRYLIPPVPKEVPYHFNNVNSDKRTGHSQWVRSYLKDQKNGIFIEAGANEGEFHSHTLNLEMELGWTGILIECNPTVTPYLRTKKRKAWVAGVCISTTGNAGVFNFSNPEKWTYSGRFGPAWGIPVDTNWTYFDVEAVPLYSIIAATGYTEIDYFGFDVEGVEMQILETFPFDKITIKLLIVEVQFLEQAKRDQFEKFMHTKDFFTVEKQGLDYIFAHKKHHSPKTNR